jgi:hypothetical protein
MDEIKQVKLRKLADEILSGGRDAVEQFNYDDYTKEELDFIIQETDERNAWDLDKFMQRLGTWKQK